MPEGPGRHWAVSHRDMFAAPKWLAQIQAVQTKQHTTLMFQGKHKPQALPKIWSAMKWSTTQLSPETVPILWLKENKRKVTFGAMLALVKPKNLGRFYTLPIHKPLPLHAYLGVSGHGRDGQLLFGPIHSDCQIDKA